MDRIWLAHYPPDVPADIDPGAYPSLAAMFEQACRLYATHPAYTSFGRTITYAELDAQSRRFAAWLQGEARLQKGDRIAIMLPNVLQYPIAMFGALRAGLVVVNTNPLYTPHEVEHQLTDSGAKVVVVYEGSAHALEEALPRTAVQHVVVTGIGDLLGPVEGATINFVLRHVQKKIPPFRLPKALAFAEVLASGDRHRFEPVAVDHEDIAYLQYTGGTTGVAKGAVLTHRNMVANVLQSQAWLRQFVTGDALVVGALPMYHIFALTAVSLLWMQQGGHVVLVVNPRDMTAFVKLFRKHRFNVFFAVNTLFNALLHADGFEKIDWSQLKASIGGGMAVQGAVAERWKRATGCILSQGWGLTETSPVAAMNPRDVDFNGSIGLPVSSTEISIQDDNGQLLPVGGVGEICVRGPQVMRGYWNRPDETAKVLTADGWLKTGDIGRMDAQGFVYIEDRKKDMILVSGFNVYPNEVESVIVKMAGVLEVAAVAQPDEHSGEVVAVFVVRKNPALTAEDVIGFCRQELTGYKVPKHVYFRGELPKTNVGKILRRQLRDELAKGAP
jgi:long-chain acyl-CoA synthetase